LSTAVEPYPGGPSVEGLDAPYWEGLREGRLTVQRCRGCETWLWGPRRVCPSCYGFDLGWESVPAVGVVYTWCRSHHPYLSELADLLPYTTVLVALPHAGDVRMLGLLTGDPLSVAIGDRVTGVVEHPQGSAWPVLRWRAGGAR
jgi:uncharacterized OB-fold protein